MNRPKRDKEHMAIRKKNNFEDRYAKGIHFDIRNKGTCYTVSLTHQLFYLFFQVQCI